MKYFRSFKEWIKMSELGTGTSSVAVFAMPIGGFNKPLKTRKKPKNITIPENFQLKPLATFGGWNASPLDSNETIPVQNKFVVPASNEIDLQKYPGKNITIFAKLWQKYKETGNKNIQNVLISAMDGNDYDMIALYNKLNKYKI